MTKVYIYNHAHMLVFVAFANSQTQIEYWKNLCYWQDGNFSYGYINEQK